MAEEMLLTKEGYEKIVAEHEELVTVRRKEVAERIKEAISYGDISENSEYDEAKNEQAEIEGKIAQLEETLKYAIVLDDKDLGTDKVGVGNKVLLHSIDTGEEMEFRIVSTTEADPLNFAISDESPLGKALLGQKIGNSISVETPGGVKKYTIAGISK